MRPQKIQAASGCIILSGNIRINLVRKNIKNLRLVIYPATGEIRLSAPLRASAEQIETFVASRISWIKKRFLPENRLRAQAAENLVDGQELYVWGKPLTLSITPESGEDAVFAHGNEVRILHRGKFSAPKSLLLLRNWQKDQVRSSAEAKTDYWRKRMRLPEIRIVVRLMKTRWGSCTPGKNKITLNAELARKSPECLEYVVVHELAHFFAPNHGQDFIDCMNLHFPDWRAIRKKLNSEP